MQHTTNAIIANMNLDLDNENSSSGDGATTPSYRQGSLDVELSRKVAAELAEGRRTGGGGSYGVQVMAVGWAAV